jgi:putative transposase
MERTADAVRFVWNLALEQRNTEWRRAKANGVNLNYVVQSRELTLLKKELPWLAEAPCFPLQRALIDLDGAFRAFFAGNARYPRFRCKGERTSFRQSGRETRVESVNNKWARIFVSKLGWVNLRLTRPWRGRVLSATFSRDALGWHVSLGCEIEHEAPTNDLPSVGIDRGIANTIALSTGELLSTPCTAKLERRKKRAHRILARRQRGSVRYRKQRERLSRITAKIARVRSHWRHEATTGIANRFGLVAVEDLNTKGMTAAGKGKRGLNRSILAQGWGALATVLIYKLEDRGGTLVTVNPAYTSQECSDCGVIDKASRESQSRFACRHCGFTAHADTNAALNILRRSTAGVEGAGYGPVEAQTTRLAA